MHHDLACRLIECRTQMLPVGLLSRRRLVTKSKLNDGTLIVRTLSRTQLNQAECRITIIWFIRCCSLTGMSPLEGGCLIYYRDESAGR